MTSKQVLVVKPPAEYLEKKKVKEKINLTPKLRLKNIIEEVPTLVPQSYVVPVISQVYKTIPFTYTSPVPYTSPQTAIFNIPYPRLRPVMIPWVKNILKRRVAPVIISRTRNAPVNIYEDYQEVDYEPVYAPYFTRVDESFFNSINEQKIKGKYAPKRKLNYAPLEIKDRLTTSQFIFNPRPLYEEDSFVHNYSPHEDEEVEIEIAPRAVLSFISRNTPSSVTSVSFPFAEEKREKDVVKVSFLPRQTRDFLKSLTKVDWE